MKFFDNDSIGWAIVVVTLLLLGAQVLRAIANGIWG
jgi:hypothetical protein